MWKKNKIKTTSACSSPISMVQLHVRQMRHAHYVVMHFVLFKFRETNLAHRA